jgi:phosphotransferase system HPr-like phosphotransfer protein
MGLARYEIVPVGKQWAVRHEGAENLEYSTKEAAFESAAAAASLAIREGHEVHISVPGEARTRS